MLLQYPRVTLHMADSGDDQRERSTSAPVRPTPMVHGVTRYDLVFTGSVCVALIALCVFSGAGTPLFLAAIGSGGGLAAFWLRFRKNRHPSIKDDEADE